MLKVKEAFTNFVLAESKVQFVKIMEKCKTKLNLRLKGVDLYPYTEVG